MSYKMERESDVSSGQVSYACANGVGTITIDNAARMNSISLAMWRQLDSILADLNDETRCIVLRGEGGKAFASGADISEFKELRREPAARIAYDEAAYGAMTRLASLKQPLIAQISGYCIGAGMALALCCDVRIAADSSVFAIPAGRLGLGYGPTELKRLMDAVGVATATDMLVSARRLNAEEALAKGLVSQIHPANYLAAQVEAYCAAVVANAPLTIQAAKRIIKELALPSTAVDRALCERLTEHCFESADYVEGINAFLAKRNPIFTGE